MGTHHQRVVRDRRRARFTRARSRCNARSPRGRVARVRIARSLYRIRAGGGRSKPASYFRRTARRASTVVPHAWTRAHTHRPRDGTGARLLWRW